LGLAVSRLAEVVISGHPDADGKRRLDLSADEKLRILMWIDLNVPFYGTSQSRQPELRGCRQILPKDLDAVLKEVAARRGITLPRTFYVRLEHPEKTRFWRFRSPRASSRRWTIRTTTDPGLLSGCRRRCPSAMTWISGRHRGVCCQVNVDPRRKMRNHGLHGCHGY